MQRKLVMSADDRFSIKLSPVEIYVTPAYSSSSGSQRQAAAASGDLQFLVACAFGPRAHASKPQERNRKKR